MMPNKGSNIEDEIESTHGLDNAIIDENTKLPKIIEKNQSSK